MRVSGTQELRRNMFSRIVVIAVVATVAALPCVAGTLTLAWTGGLWNDGGSLNGTFTVSFDDITGAPLALLSADVQTGNGTSDGFIGQSYVFAVPGQTDTVTSDSFDATQSAGAPANELVLGLGSGYITFLDWQGTSPTTLWVGNVGGQYSSENNPDFSIVRSLNTSGGSAGTPDPAPEPSSLALFGSGLIGFGMMFRRLRPKH